MMRLVSAACLLVVTLMATACSGGEGGVQPAADTEHVSLEVQTSIDQGHIMSQMMDRFAELVDEYSDGQIELTIRYNDPFGELYDISEQVGRGMRPMAGGLFFPELDPRFNIAVMGGLVTNWDEAKQIYGPDGPMLKLLNDIGREAGAVALGVAPTGFGGTSFRGAAPTSLPSDTRYQVRVPPYEGMDARMQALGFDTVVMPFGEVYTALQTGVLDGKGATPPQEAAQIFADVTDAYVYDRSYFEAMWAILVSVDWFDELSPSAQEVLSRAGHEASEWAWGESEKSEQKLLAELESKNVELIEFTAEEYADIARISREHEWPVVKKLAGNEVMDAIREMQRAID